MKKYIFLLISIIIISIPGSARDKKQIVTMIEDVESKIEEFKKNDTLKPFIPFDIYNDAVIGTINARNLIQDKEYDNAYYYASISKVKLETAIILAQVGEIRHRKIQLEIGYYKENSDNTDKLRNYKAILMKIIEANLQKKGDVFTIDVTDKTMFLKKKYRLSYKGKDILKKITDVLKTFPKSEIKIVGHTSFFDVKKYSIHKAEVIAKYFIRRNINSKRIKVIGLGNKEVMNTAVGFRRIDRTEIILSGLE